MRRGRLSIPTRIFLGFTVVILAFGAVAVASVFEHDRSARSLRLLNEGYLPLALTLGEAKSTQAVFATLLDRVVDQNRSATGWFKAARSARPATLRRAYHGLRRSERLAAQTNASRGLTAVRRELDAIKKDIRSTDTNYEALFKYLAEGDDEKAQSVLPSLRENERSIQRHYRNAWRLLQERVATISADAAERERQAAVVLGVLGLLALMAALFVTWWSQRMLSPLPELHQRVRAVARGDLTSVFERQRDDELGQLSTEFERMVDALAARDKRLTEGAEARRRLQKMQEQIVAALRSAVLVVQDGKIGTINPAAAQILDLSEDAIDSALHDTQFGTSLPAVTKAIDKATRGEVSVLSDVDYHGRLLDMRVSPFGSSDDAVLVVADDITEERATEQRLIQTERLAAIGQMAAHVTHEVRNPLSSIGLNVEMLGDEVTGTEARALMGAIQKEIDRLTDITEEYLRLARLPRPALVREDVGEFLELISEFVRREFSAAGVSLVLNIAPHLPQVDVDEGQLRQAMLNLIRNAKEAMPEGGTVKVSAAEEGSDVAIVIEDEGPGIPSGERAKVFDLFYSTKERGTGLGLPLTQQIVVAHGGHIRCEAADPKGTRFTVSLPISASPTRQNA